MKQRGEWRPVTNIVSGWDQKLASVACRQLNCGSVVSTKIRNPSDKPAWWISETCVQSDSIPLLRECLKIAGKFHPPINLEVICSGNPEQGLSVNFIFSIETHTIFNFLHRYSGSAKHLLLPPQWRVVRGQAASGAPGLQFHHQLLHPAPASRRLFPAYFDQLSNITELHPGSCQSLCPLPVLCCRPHPPRELHLCLSRLRFLLQILLWEPPSLCHCCR